MERSRSPVQAEGIKRGHMCLRRRWNGLYGFPPGTDAATGATRLATGTAR